MENTLICVLVISIFFLCFVSQRYAGNKQIQALDNLYKTKRSVDSTIDTSHIEPPRNVTRDMILLSQDGLKKKDKISNFPGQPFVKFDQYGGYVTVNESAGRAFYYYFVEAETSKQHLPLLLWLNGGNITQKPKIIVSKL